MLFIVISPNYYPPVVLVYHVHVLLVILVELTDALLAVLGRQVHPARAQQGMPDSYVLVLLDTPFSCPPPSPPLDASLRQYSFSAALKTEPQTPPLR